MRSLSSSLTAAQKVGGNVLAKAVFTKSGQATQTFDISSSANALMRLSHTETEWSQTADVMVENGDGTLTALDLTGYTCTISYGYHTSSDEYSAAAPLEVIAQQGTTQFLSGRFYVIFSCAGVFDMMAKDEALIDYSYDDTNTNTCKAILTYIAQATQLPFARCKAYTITFDSEDSLIDTYKPANSYQVGFRESRLSVFKRVLGWTKCSARIEDDGEIHIFNLSGNTAPHYISGATYNYEYNDAVTKHNFFEKSVRNRLVIPNYVHISSYPEDEPQYSGNASDTTSYTALGRYMFEYHWQRLTSDTQADAIAAAILQSYQLGQERGHGSAPLNCGQEVMDYILITDSAAGDTRTGNIGYIHRLIEAGKFDMEFRFGSPDFGLAGAGAESALSLSQRVSILEDTMNRTIASLNNTIRNVAILVMRNRVSTWHIQNLAIAPVRIPERPAVWTEKVTNIAATTATGSGDIRALGAEGVDITAHGVCWTTSGTPTIADSKTDEGATSTLGIFTTSMTGLITETAYYVSAYATNEYGTSYGDLEVFETL